MAFLNIRFPLHISYGSKGGPQFNTTVLELSSGFEKRNINWSEVKALYEAQHGIKDRPQMEELLRFFYVANGKAHSWRYKDFLDFAFYNQNIGTGDGVTRKFQMKKRYAVGPYFYDRRITKPVQGTLQNLRVANVVKTEGTHFTVDYNTGLVTFTVPQTPANGAAVTIDYCEFDVHCRFDTDHFDATHDFWETMSWPSIPITEVKEKQAS